MMNDRNPSQLKTRFLTLSLSQALIMFMTDITKSMIIMTGLYILFLLFFVS